jgi:aspartate aminotransferase
MKTLSKRLQNITASQTVAMNQRSNELKEQGIDIINLSVGEPDFNTPQHIKEAAKNAIDDNISFYSPVAGFPSLRQAIANKLNRENNLDYQSHHIVVSNGGKHAIINTLLALLDKGDEVIIPAPYWVSYPEQVKLAGGKPVIIASTLDNNFKVSASQIEDALTEKTKVLVICTPSNPTGSVYNKRELAEIAAVIEKHPRVFVISDEIYEYINFTEGHQSIAQFGRIKDRVVLINGVSKGFAMTGWRIGYMAADEELAKACTKLQGQMTTGACSISQMAALEALLSSKKPSKEMVRVYLKRRNMIMQLLDNIEGIRYSVPQGAFYIFPDVSYYYGKSYQGKSITDSTGLVYYLLEEAHVGLVMGDAFGAPDCVRISYATSEELISKAIGQIKAALEKLT